MPWCSPGDDLVWQQKVLCDRTSSCHGRRHTGWPDGAVELTQGGWTAGRTDHSQICEGTELTIPTYVCCWHQETKPEKRGERRAGKKERRERRKENSAHSYLWMLLALRKESVASQSNRGTRWWWRKRSGRPRNWGSSRATPSSTVNVPTTSTLNPALHHHYIIVTSSLI